MKKSLIIQIAAFMILGCYHHLSAVEERPDGLNENRAQAGVKRQNNERKTESTAFSGFKKGVSFRSDQETYEFLPELYSIAKYKQTATGAYTLSKPKSMPEDKASDLVEKKGHFSIYKSGDGTRPTLMTVQTKQERTLFPVALNPRTNNLAIVMGIIKVELEDIDQAESIATDLGLIVRKKFGHLKTVYFAVAEGQDILAKSEDLKSDTRVTKATIEVLENIMVPQ